MLDFKNNSAKKDKRLKLDAASFVVAVVSPPHTIQ